MRKIIGTAITMIPIVCVLIICYVVGGWLCIGITIGALLAIACAFIGPAIFFDQM